MDILWFCLGGFFSAAVIVIVLQHRKIQELQGKNEQEADKTPSSSASKLCIMGKQFGVILLKCLLWFAELFRWQGRYRRVSFWPRFILLYFLCIKLTEHTDAYLCNEFLAGRLTMQEFNFLCSIRIFLAGCLIAPCVAKRLHDAGYSSLWWLGTVLFYIPRQLLIDWSGMEYVYNIFISLCTICSLVSLIGILTDSKENNKWGVSPKYPEGK